MLKGIAGELSIRPDHIFSTEESGVYKPAPEVYDLPVHALGIAREAYLYVAGSANDVIGAKSAGVACYWNNRTDDRVLLPEFAADAEGTELRGVLGRATAYKVTVLSTTYLGSHRSKRPGFSSSCS